MNRLVLVDGNAILYRAYHAMPNFTSSSGDPVGAIFGFTSMLLKIIQDLKPTHLIAAFDRSAPTFRQELYVAYHANRREMEEDLVTQIPGVDSILKAFSIPIFAVDGYEADDVIGTLSVQATKEKHTETIIVTGDRDLLQLVNQHVRVYMPIKGLTETKMYDEAAVEEKYGIKAEQVVDLKALMGDASDNYPGVSGIGPKGASILIKKYETLENLYKHLEDLPERQMKALADDAEQAALAKKLATIVCDMPIHLKMKDCGFEIREKQKIVEVLLEFGLRTLTNRFLEFMGEKPKPKTKTKKDSDQLSFV